MTKILHFSDVHFPITRGLFSLKEMRRPKRLAAFTNYWLRRRECFEEAVQKWEAFVRFAQALDVDGVVCTGDMTALGCRAELHAAHAALQPFLARTDFVLMPGNHDVYLPGETAGYFNDIFASYYEGDFLFAETGRRYPLAKIVNDDVAIVAVNSVKPNPVIWRSSGLVAPDERVAFEKLCAHPALRARRLLVATHYNVDEEDGELHGLEHRDSFRAVVEQQQSAALVHGHIHHEMIYTLPGGTVPVFGAGSLTYKGRETFHVYDMGETVVCQRGYWTGERYDLEL